MRVNVYAEEMTDRLEIISKEIEGQKFTGLRFYLELPVTQTVPGSLVDGCMGVQETEPQVKQISGPFMHHPGDDDSAAVTFWGKRDLRNVLRQALSMLDAHYLKTRKPLDEPVQISINGEQRYTSNAIWTYEMLANSAGLNPSQLYTATFSKANQSKTDGILSPGGSVLVGNGTRFSICDTSNA